MKDEDIAAESPHLNDNDRASTAVLVHANDYDAAAEPPHPTTAEPVRVSFTAEPLHPEDTNRTAVAESNP